MLVVLYCIHYEHLQRAFLTMREKKSNDGGWAVKEERRKVMARDRSRVWVRTSERERTLHTDKAFLSYGPTRRCRRVASVIFLGCSERAGTSVSHYISVYKYIIIIIAMTVVNQDFVIVVVLFCFVFFSKRVTDQCRMTDRQTRQIRLL